MNLSDTTRTLHEGTQLGDIYPVEPSKHVQGMLWVDSDLSDLESDDDESTDVHAIGSTSKSASAKTPRSNARDDARMDPKDLPEHLQPLMEWISEDITIREREELAAAIYEYMDVFNSGPEDMGQTDLVTLTIDTGEHHHICLPLRWLPITKQDVEKAEVQEMLDRGVIEPYQSSWASPVVLVTIIIIYLLFVAHLYSALPVKYCSEALKYKTMLKYSKYSKIIN